jgi:GT2 family glycosyltransferase
MRRGLEKDRTKILVDEFNRHPILNTAICPDRRFESSMSLGQGLIIIPFRDQWPMTKMAINSIVSSNIDSMKIKILLIDNGSVEDQTQAGLNRLQREHHDSSIEIDALRIDEPFNFSRLNNLGVNYSRHFNPDWLFFMNNDIEIADQNQFRRLITFANSTPGAGAVGCTLLYPNSQIQHLFVAPGVKIVGAHPLKRSRFSPQDAWFNCPRPVPAVTGAALWVSLEAFDQVGGFDESLPTVGQDVDLCLKLQGQGFTNWVIPTVQMIHHESLSRRKGVQTIARREVERFYQKWGAELAQNNHYPPSLSRWSEAPVLTIGEKRYPWTSILSKN